MADSGWLNPGTVVNDPTAGSWDWANPDNAKTDNNIYANRSGGKSGLESRYLKATNFSFSIPGTATIVGIIVQIERMASFASAVADVNVRIVKATGAFGSENKALGGYWSTVESYFAYGNSTNLWSESWTPANINNSNFGVGMNAYIDAFTIASVDHIRIKVYYTEVVLTNMKINIGDAWKDVDEIKINIGDSWKVVTQIQINIGDVWKTIFG